MTPSNETPSLSYLENAFRSLQKQMHQLDQEEAREKLDRDAARQREINRRNARKSTGPRTEAGKAASSKNRLAHGLCSSSLLVFGETQEEFNQLEQQILATYNPATPEENLLSSQLTEALWRLNRARRVETATLDRMMDQTDRELSRGGLLETDPDTGVQLGACFSNGEHRKTLASLNRYVTAAERTYRAALKTLQDSIKSRPQPAPAEPEAAKTEENVATKALAAGQSFHHKLGFVSQNAPSEAVAVPAYHDRC
ncbi:MAG: hypothetical protein ACK58M_19980 [Acidobacteriota bacterium]